MVTGQMHRHTIFVVFAPVAGRDSLAYPRKSFYTLLPPPLRDHKSVPICRVFLDFLCFRKGGKYSHIWRTKTKGTRAKSVAHCALPIRRRNVRENEQESEKIRCLKSPRTPRVQQLLAHLWEIITKKRPLAKYWRESEGCRWCNKRFFNVRAKTL